LIVPIGRSQARLKGALRNAQFFFFVLLDAALKNALNYSLGLNHAAVRIFKPQNAATIQTVRRYSPLTSWIFHHEIIQTAEKNPHPCRNRQGWGFLGVQPINSCKLMAKHDTTRNVARHKNKLKRAKRNYSTHAPIQRA
jgi:hypothetical protein